MTDQTPRPDRKLVVALNRLTAACEAASDELAGMYAAGTLSDSGIRILEAFRNYQGARTDTDRARDLFLSRFPDAQTMQDELDRRRADRQPT